MNKFEARMRQRGQGGFTLIELLVVIAILAVLGGAVIIGIGALTDTAEEEVCSTNRETILLAIEAASIGQGIDRGDVNNAQLTGPPEYIRADTLAGWTVTNGAITGNPYAEFDNNCDPV